MFFYYYLSKILVIILLMTSITKSFSIYEKKAIKPNGFLKGKFFASNMIDYSKIKEIWDTLF